ncbi:MAG: IS1634 family transposase [Acidobacteriota bacterium]
MERLETKKIHGRTYYYYSRWAWVNGRCRRVWQKYLGKLEEIVKAVDGSGPAPLYAEVFQFGLPTALWQQCQEAGVVELSDRICPKRKQGMSTGEYLAVAAVNRAMQPRSKRSMREWFSQTTLLRHLPQGSAAALASQRFWDHMERIDADQAGEIWKRVLQGVLQRERWDLSAISYDGTNFYTFMDSFNAHSQLARRGKNKQGRSNLRQISYALFCCQDGPLPLYWGLYEGNRTDVRQFPLMLARFHDFFREISGGGAAPETTLIFDKGNNSKKNFRLLDRLKMKFVGSVKLSEHKEWVEVSNRDARLAETGLEGTRAFRVRKRVYGRARILVVTYNEHLFQAQWLTLQNDLNKALGKLSLLQGRLRDRAEGLIRGGKTPTVDSVGRQCARILKRQYLKQVVQVRVEGGDGEVPTLHYQMDPQALHRISDTYLGKTLLITNRPEWDDSTIIRAYRSQFVIESVFQQTKDRHIGSWWPLHHWTDSKIRVHGLYCTIALLLRAVLLRRVQKAGVPLTMKRLLSELDGIREVVNIYPKKRRDTKAKTQTVLTKTSDLQNRLLSILELKKEEKTPLG